VQALPTGRERVTSTHAAVSFSCSITLVRDVRVGWRIGSRTKAHGGKGEAMGACEKETSQAPPREKKQWDGNQWLSVGTAQNGASTYRHADGPMRLGSSATFLHRCSTCLSVSGFSILIVVGSDGRQQAIL
jgi:hypothetical protein